MLSTLSNTDSVGTYSNHSSRGISLRERPRSNLALVMESEGCLSEATLYLRGSSTLRSAFFFPLWRWKRTPDRSKVLSGLNYSIGCCKIETTPGIRLYSNMCIMLTTLTVWKRNPDVGRYRKEVAPPNRIWSRIQHQLVSPRKCLFFSFNERQVLRCPLTVIKCPLSGLIIVQWQESRENYQFLEWHSERVPSGEISCPMKLSPEINCLLTVRFCCRRDFFKRDYFIDGKI